MGFGGIGGKIGDGDGGCSGFWVKSEGSDFAFLMNWSIVGVVVDVRVTWEDSGCSKV